MMFSLCRTDSMHCGRPGRSTGGKKYDHLQIRIFSLNKYFHCSFKTGQKLFSLFGHFPLYKDFIIFMNIYYEFKIEIMMKLS